MKVLVLAFLFVFAMIGVGYAAYLVYEHIMDINVGSAMLLWSSLVLMVIKWVEMFVGWISY